MSIKKTDYEYDNSAVKMTHCPMCGDELCGNGWSYHIQDKPECRETALTRLEELSSGTHRRGVESRETERETRQATL